MREAGPRKKVPRRGAAGQWAFLGWGKLHGKTEPNGADQLLVPALAHHRDRFAQGVAEKHQRESRALGRRRSLTDGLRDQRVLGAVPVNQSHRDRHNRKNAKAAQPHNSSFRR